MAIIRVRVRNAGGKHTWFETYDIPEIPTNDPHFVDRARSHVRDILARYNNTLRQGEIAREAISAKVIGISKKHLWEKHSLVTVKRGGRYFDEMKCAICGHKGKRYGIGGSTVADRNQHTCKRAK